MKKCKCFGDVNDVAQWEMPRHHYGDRTKFLHICARCGHIHAPDGYPDAEEQASSGDGNAAL